MSEKYYYTKVLDSTVLEEAINLRTSVRQEFISCHVTLNNDGTAPTDNIELEFSRALISSEQDEITDIVNAIGPAYDLLIRKNIETNTMKWAMEKGEEILRQFAANNLYRGKDAESVERLVTEYPELIHSLVTGSLSTAYTTFASMVPNADITQEEIDEFTLRLAIILGL